jgi:hypothetical protein
MPRVAVVVVVLPVALLTLAVVVPPVAALLTLAVVVLPIVVLPLDVVVPRALCHPSLVLPCTVKSTIAM